MIAGFAAPAAVVLLPAAGDAGCTGGGVCAEARSEFGEAATPRMATTVAASANGKRRDVIDPPRSACNSRILWTQPADQSLPACAMRSSPPIGLTRLEELYVVLT